MAKKMALPFGVLTAGVNINDFTDVAFKTGWLAQSTEPMKMTLSEAINIQLPYNLERLLFYMTGERHDLIKKWYQTLGEEGMVQLDAEWLKKLQVEFRSSQILDDQVCAITQEVLEDYNYWIDPHTAVAFATAKQWGYLNAADSEFTDSAVAIMATASPCKFQKALTVALGKHRWQEYENCHFPEQGRAVLQKTEVPPATYPIQRGVTKEETQKIWEKMARDLIISL